MLKSFSERDTPTGDANYDTLKADYEALKGDIESKYVEKEKYETANTRATNALKGNFKTKLSVAAAKKLGDSANVRHFEDNFFNDALDLVQNEGIGKTKVKGVIDYETGKIMRADSPDQPLLFDGKVVTLADVADLTIERFEYKTPVSNPAPTGVITTKTGNEVKDTNSAARQRNLDLDKEE